MMSVDQFMCQDTIYEEVRRDEQRSTRSYPSTSINISDDEANDVYGLKGNFEGLCDL